MPEASDMPDAYTPLDIERKYRIPRSTQKRARAAGTFAPYYAVGSRVYYLRSTFEQWIAVQEQAAAGTREQEQAAAGTQEED